MELVKEQIQFSSKIDLHRISALRIEPENKAEIKGILQIVHGMCEYKERYLPLMEYFSNKGYLCVIHDHRGHGKSVVTPEDLGYFYDGGYKGMIEDIHEMTRLTKEYVTTILPEKKLPYILMGHSMGSLAVRCFMKRYSMEIDKLIVMGCPSPQPGVIPGLCFLEVIKTIKGPRGRSKLADFVVMDSRYEKQFKEEGIKRAWLNSDVSEVERYNKDSYCNFSFTLNGYVNLVKLNMETYSLKGYENRNSNIPICFFSGQQDPCRISDQAFLQALNVMKNAGFTNVTSKLYPNMRHEILLEPDKAIVYEDLLQFIEG